MIALAFVTLCALTCFGAVMATVAIASDRKADARHFGPMLTLVCVGVAGVVVILAATRSRRYLPLTRSPFHLSLTLKQGADKAVRAQPTPPSQ